MSGKSDNRCVVCSRRGRYLTAFGLLCKSHGVEFVDNGSTWFPIPIHATDVPEQAAVGALATDVPEQSHAVGTLVYRTGWPGAPVGI